MWRKSWAKGEERGEMREGGRKIINTGEKQTESNEALSAAEGIRQDIKRMTFLLL